MNYNYSKLKETWVCEENIIEGYEDPIVNMPLYEWNEHVSRGDNVMYPAIKSNGKSPNPFMRVNGCGCGGGGRMIF